jgi:cell division transport system permease protein
MGSVSLLSLNIDALIKDLENQNEIVVFVDESLNDEAAARDLQRNIEAVENVASVQFVSRGEAMNSFMSKYDASLMEGIDEGVFRHRFVVHLNDIAHMSQTKADLEAIRGVAKVNAHLDYAKSFVTIRNVVTVVSMVLIVMLVFVSFFIMSNTIKLATFGRREEIAIMKMVGATNSFIRLPFVVEGLVLGIMGGCIAFLATWGLYNLVTGQLVGSLTGAFLNVIPFRNYALQVFVVFMGISILVGVFGGMNAIRNYLKV